MTYNHIEIEKKWQKYWEKNKTFFTDVWDFSKPKYYALDMFPYPSGQGLHVGHPEGYTATDILSRMKRMQGYNVLHPMGWDAFGLPAEQYAIKTGNHPAGFSQEKTLKLLKDNLKCLDFLLIGIRNLQLVIQVTINGLNGFFQIIIQRWTSKAC